MFSISRLFEPTVVVPLLGAALCCRSAVDGHILAYRVVVSDDAGCCLATVFQVLWLCRDACAGEYLVSRAHACSLVKCDGVLHHVVVAYDNVGVDIAERTDDVVVSQFGIRVYECHRTDSVCHIMCVLVSPVHCCQKWHSGCWGEFLFVFYNLCCERSFADHIVSYEHVSLHRRDAMSDRSEQLYSEQECVARHNFLLELHVVDGEEVC